MRHVVAVTLVLLAVGCSPGPESPPAPSETPFDPAAWASDLAAWRAEREARLVSEYGWLSVIGLDWLQEGDNAVGSDPQGAVVLPAEVAPPRIATLTLRDGVVRIVPEPGAPLTLDGRPVEAGEVATDADPAPDTFRIDDLQFVVLRRGDRFGVRSRWPRSPRRAAFEGLSWYDGDPAWRIAGRLERDPEPVTIDVPNILGATEASPSPGTVSFVAGGRERTLRPIHDGPDDRELFFIFRDRTTGHGTYPAGRFLYATWAEDDTVVLDFNRAYSPPCAFTPHATCPLPPAGNALDLAVEAGERYAGGH